MSILTYAAAAAAAERLGIDPVAILREGVDALLGWLGIGQCSGTNKAKYRALVSGRTPEDLLRRLETGNFEGTGNCRKYHQAKMAEKVLRAAKRADEARARDEACKTGEAVMTDHGVLVMPPPDCKPAIVYQPWMSDLYDQWAGRQLPVVALPGAGLQAPQASQQQQAQGGGGAAVLLLALPFLMKGF